MGTKISKKKLSEIYNALDSGKCVVVDVRCVSKKQLIYIIERAVITGSPPGGLDNCNIRIELF